MCLIGFFQLSLSLFVPVATCLSHVAGMKFWNEHTVTIINEDDESKLLNILSFMLLLKNKSKRIIQFSTFSFICSISFSGSGVVERL